MVKTGLVSAIHQMTYTPPQGVGGVETMTFDRLRAINDGGTQRADFHVVALVDAGAGSVVIDFERHALAPQTALWIGAGAVHRWEDIADLTGQLVLFVPTAPVTQATRELVASPDVIACWRIDDDEWPLVDAACRHVILEATSTVVAGEPTELPAILLSGLIARLRPPHRRTGATNEVFELFQASVEAHFREHHDVGYYAATLGYAPRTLSRAAQQVTGRSAKACIVERLVLEAKRLLAHDRFTAARCGSALGFPDASNFSVFFDRATGMRPGAWQAAATPSSTG